MHKNELGLSQETKKRIETIKFELLKAQWKERSSKFPKTGSAGFSYSSATSSKGEIDLEITYRHSNGELLAFFEYHEEDVPNNNFFGKGEVCVNPSYWGTLIGNKILLKALKKWPDLELWKQEVQLSFYH